MKVHISVDKYGIPLAIDTAPANVHDTTGIVPVLRRLAGQGFQGPALGDLGDRSERLSKAGAVLGITIEPVAGGRKGTSIPAGICRTMERSFGWLALVTVKFRLVDGRRDRYRATMTTRPDSR
ncbi:hypothetical protein J2852_005710 [Azospirillum soli]|nr:hypothetical protein [Azospirillum soli]